MKDRGRQNTEGNRWSAKDGGGGRGVPPEQPSSRAAEQAAEQPEQHNGQRAQSAAAVRWQRGGSGAAMHRQLGEELAVQNSAAEAELATAYGGHARGEGGGVGADNEVVGTMVQPSGPPPAPR